MDMNTLKALKRSSLGLDLYLLVLRFPIPRTELERPKTVQRVVTGAGRGAGRDGGSLPHQPVRDNSSSLSDTTLSSCL